MAYHGYMEIIKLPKLRNVLNKALFYQWPSNLSNTIAWSTGIYRILLGYNSSIWRNIYF
jgi:hypothetical protein